MKKGFSSNTLRDSYGILDFVHTTGQIQRVWPKEDKK